MGDGRTYGGDQPGSSDQARPADEPAGNDLIDEDTSFEIEWGLPLGAENFLTGEPLVVVDYFDLASSDPAATSERLLGLEGAVRDEGAPPARILIFDQHSGAEPFDVRSLIAIATVHGATLRLETARQAITDPVCDAVRNLLGPDARYRGRSRENPIEVYLTSP